VIGPSGGSTTVLVRSRPSAGLGPEPQDSGPTGGPMAWSNFRLTFSRSCAFASKFDTAQSSVAGDSATSPVQGFGTSLSP
jgi:hypothetical protein